MRWPSLLPLVLVVNLAVAAAPGDERWSHEFYSPTFGTINTIAFTSNGDLICGGTFDSVAGVANTPRIARWDGTNWFSIGGGIPSATIFAVLPVGSDLFVGGSFISVQGQNITNLARWDGTNWSAVGGGVAGGSVRSLAWHNGALFVGGLFTSAGGNAAGYVASWDGASWSTLNGGVQASSPSSSAVPISSMLSFDGALYAGGRFFSAGGVSANNIARWNGTAWESLGLGANNGVDNGVAALAGDTNGVVFAGGAFVHAGTNTVNYLATWNGSIWSAVGGGVSDPVSAGVNGLLISGSDVYVAGNFNSAGATPALGLARWDGFCWFRVATPVRHPMSRLVAHGSRIVALGTLQNVMIPPTQKGLVQFDGQGWSILGGGLAGTSGGSPTIQTVATGHGKVQVSGRFGVSDGSGVRTIVAEWNGRGWTNLGNGLPVAFLDNYFIHDFLSVSDVTYGAGQFFGGPSGVAVLTSNVWADLGAPLSSGGLSLALYRGALFAGHGSGISRWTGSAWTNVGTGLEGAVYDLVVLGDALYASGTFTNSGPTVVNYIARWDGTNWSPLGAGVNAPTYTLAATRNVLYAGGIFTQAGGTPALSVARWSNLTWTALGGGLSPSVSCLTALSDGRLFAAGNFTSSGSTPLNFISTWNGSNWIALGSGLNAPVLGLAADEKDLYAGGEFTTAGGVPSLRMARWHIPESLRLSLSLPLVGPQVTLQITGELGTSYAVEASADLIQWTAITTNAVTGHPTQLSVFTNGLPKLFFRLRNIP